MVMLWLGRGKLALEYLVATIAVSLATWFLEFAGLADPRPYFLLVSKFSLLTAAAFNIGGFFHARKIRDESLAKPWYRWLAVLNVGLLLLVFPVRVFLYQP